MTLTSRYPVIFAALAFCLVLVLLWAGQSGLAQDFDPAEISPTLDLTAKAREMALPAGPQLDPLSFTPCESGSAGGYPCLNTDLLAFMPIANIGGGTGADLWGWTDPADGKEYALLGRTSGTSFVDISDPENPIYLGNLASETGSTTWRDVKVYNNYAFIVSDNNNNGEHGIQIFDLTRLRSVASPPESFSADHVYHGFGSAHNIAINEESGYAYGVGVSSGSTTCGGGLHFVDIQNPLSPVFDGCFSAAGYSHDAQCVTYAGPDPDHQGKEICINSNGSSALVVADVTDKANPQQLDSISYSGLGYIHQGWLTTDHQYFLLGDELDELNFGHNTRTRVFDVRDLDNIELIGYYDSTVPATDHNLYTDDYLAYLANYASGLRILDLLRVDQAILSEVAYFDTYVGTDAPGFPGAWTAFPYYDSGVVTISSRHEGLFIVRPTLAELQVSQSNPSGILQPGDTLSYTITVANEGLVVAASVMVTDTLKDIPSLLGGAEFIPPGSSAQYIFEYTIQESDCGTTLINKVSASTDSSRLIATAPPRSTQIICDGGFTYLPLVGAGD